MEFFKQNLSTLILIGIAAVWLGITMGTDRCPSCVIVDIAADNLRAEDQSEEAEAPPAPEFPAWSVVDSQGHTLASHELNGKVSVVMYWASWCADSKKETPDLVALRDEFSATEVEILGISVDEAHKDLQAFAQKHGINYRIARVNDSIKDAFGSIESIPTVIVIDQFGRIQFKHTGRISGDALEQRVRNLLASGGPSTGIALQR